MKIKHYALEEKWYGELDVWWCKLPKYKFNNLDDAKWMCSYLRMVKRKEVRIVEVTEEVI